VVTTHVYSIILVVLARYNISLLLIPGETIFMAESLLIQYVCLFTLHWSETIISHNPAVLGPIRGAEEQPGRALQEIKQFIYSVMLVSNLAYSIK
jgi:hypothetical protein